MRLSRFSQVTQVARTRSSLACAAALVVAALTGCQSIDPTETKSWIDPSELAGRSSKESLVVKIMDQVDPGVEEPNTVFVTAQPPTQEDLVVSASDYVISKNDYIVVEISDLQGLGTQTRRETRVSESGNINLTLLKQPVKIEGLTEGEAIQAIQRAYADQQVVDNAQVSVTVVEARGRVINITGAVAQPAPYTIIDPDFRVLDALALARGTTSPLLTDLYIIRRTDLGRASAPGTSSGGSSGTGTTTAPASGPGSVDDLKPQSALPANHPSSALINPTAAAGHRGRGVALVAQNVTPGRPLLLADDPSELAPAPAPADAASPSGAAPADPDAKGRTVWIDGRQVFIADPSTAPADAAAPTAAAAPGAEPTPTPPPGPAVAAPDSSATATPGTTADGSMTAARAPAAAAPSSNGNDRFQFNELTAPQGTRVIHIPLDRLMSGELQYNVVVKPKDTIYVKPLEFGVYYMSGHVGRPGPYSLSGSKVTLKQAVSSAGMLDQLAIPERTDIVRRIGTNKEVYVRVNLTKIFEGGAPDIFLKPDDQVIVGTNMLAPFLAAIRGAFRFTYGLGFLYDRNFYNEFEDANR